MMRAPFEVHADRVRTWRALQNAVNARIRDRHAATLRDLDAEWSALPDSPERDAWGKQWTHRVQDEVSA